MLEAELIISSDDLDEEYEMLQKKYGKEIDNIEFFMYIKRRVNAAYNKDSFHILFYGFPGIRSTGVTDRGGSVPVRP